jgi:hypothetical protein
MGYMVGRGHEHTGPGTAMIQFNLPNMAYRGMGCCGNCAPGFTCNGAGLRGLGLFDSGMDFTSWGWQEWAVVGAAGYILSSMFFTGRRAVRQVREGVGKRVRRARRRLGSRIAGQEI